ncbi:uncharacterized protein LOC122077307 [Macadamia integrifolia]|uniref:uncharacterized protein LOC122077307 n=1 Tax=Macadamia integrifolia TaxID=60698 RepID=UPI001C4EED9A|nr:uncharacterized protein LOC122077307 [Macadamia integrifolia]
MGRHADGIENLSCMTQDVRNYLRTKRQRALTYSEAGSLMKYFVTQTRNNPSFTYSFQLDSEKQRTNIFWTDPKMIIDYTEMLSALTLHFAPIKSIGRLGCLLDSIITEGAPYSGPHFYMMRQWNLLNGYLKYLLKHMVERSHIYGPKSQWAKCYMKNTLTIGIRSTQLSENLNNDLKDYLKSTLNVIPRRANSMSIVQKQVGELYIPVIFQLFQEEYNWMTVCTIISRTDGNSYIYFWVGIYEAEYIKRIPEYNILKRWTQGTTNMVVNDSRGKEVEQDVNLDCTQRYRRICHELIQIASEASNTVEGYELVKDTANELRLKLGNIRNPVDRPDMPIFPHFSDDV